MKKILMLHGAIGSEKQFHPLLEAIGNQLEIWTFNFSGHGGKPFSDKPFMVIELANEVLDFLDSHEITQVHIFGYSMGGYVGMYLAMHHPERVVSVATLATKWRWSTEIAAKETKMLQPELIQEKLPHFALQLQERHHPNNWTVVLKKTAELMQELGNQPALVATDLSKISCPCCLIVGDKDKMVSIDETLEFYNALPKSSLAVLPQTFHPIEQISIPLLQEILLRFWCNID